MEKNLEKLEKSIKSGDFDTACEILKELEKTQPEIIPVKLLQAVINRGSGRAPTLAMRILSNLALKKREAQQIFIEFLSSQDDERRSLAFAFMVMNFSMKDYAIVPSHILLKLIEDPIFGIRRRILSILSKVAEETPQDIPADVLFKAMLKEKDSLIREQILKIANIVNPVDRPSRFLKINTLYLINWVQKQIGAQSTNVPELLGEMQSRYVTGPYEFTLVRGLIAESCVVDAFLFMMPKRYRGHEIHQFNVGALGLLLLKAYVSSSETLEEYISKLMNWKSTHEVEKAWLMASFLHDHAIPLSYMFQILPVINEYKIVFSSYSTPYDTYLRALDLAYHNLFSSSLFEVYDLLSKGKGSLSLLENLVSTELTRIGFLPSIRKEQFLDHGILAAINLTTRLRSKNNDYVDKNEIVKTTVKAIAVHNLPEKIELEKEPIAFLLVLCDELQEWEREVALLPNILPETSSIKIGPFTCTDGKLFFEKEFVTSFEYPSRKILNQTGWDYEKFKNGKNFTENRLILTNPDINPQKIDFKITA